MVMVLFCGIGVLLGVWRNIEDFSLMVYILQGSLNDLWTAIIVSIITNMIPFHRIDFDHSSSRDMFNTCILQIDSPVIPIRSRRISSKRIRTDSVMYNLEIYASSWLGSRVQSSLKPCPHNH